MILNEEGVIALLNQYEKESKAIREDLLRICWYMRGSISYDDAMMLSQQEKDIINKIIKDNMEITKKSGLPFF